jgi:DNA-binding CsgD family transcriptional regulator/sensor histidine kinase regulating citrate/malate metabolism
MSAMKSMIQNILDLSRSQTFRTSLLLILVAEAVTIVLGWALINSNITKTVRDEASQLVQLSQMAADSGDWSAIGTVPKEKKGSKLFATYRQKLKGLSKQHFPNNQGAFFITVLDGKEEWILTQDDPTDPMFDNGEADPWELKAYSSGKPTHTDSPYTDDTGTSMLAYTPIFRNAKIVGLIGVTLDSATLADLQEKLGKVYWLSVLPAILASLLVAYALASMFLRPTDVLRTIEETAQSQRTRTPEEEKNDPWNRLTPKHKEIADLLRRGRVSYKELAESLGVEQSTIAQHFKDIKARTGWSKTDLAMEAAGRRSASLGA